MYKRGNKIAPLWHACLTSLGTSAKGAQFYYPTRTYPAIPFFTIFPFLKHCAISSYFPIFEDDDESIRK